MYTSLSCRDQTTFCEKQENGFLRADTYYLIVYNGNCVFGCDAHNVRITLEATDEKSFCEHPAKLYVAASNALAVELGFEVMLGICSLILFLL